MSAEPRTPIRTAMVLAAGLGERMRPLTDTLPKPLVRLSGQPLIDYALDRLADAGVEKAVVNVHYLADQIEAHLAGRARPEIHISDETDQLLDTGGGIVRALPELGPGPFFVHNSDTVWMEGATPNLVRMINSWDPERMDVLLLLAPISACLGYNGDGDFAMAQDGQLRRRNEREIAPFVYAGVCIVAADAFADAPQGAFSLVRIFDKAALEGRLFGVRLDGVWMHVGSPDALAAAERWLADAVTG